MVFEWRNKKIKTIVIKKSLSSIMKYMDKFFVYTKGGNKLWKA